MPVTPRTLGLITGTLLWACATTGNAAAPPAPGANAVSTASIPAAIRQVFERSGVPAQGVGVMIREAGSTESLVELGADQAFIPASTMKLVTTIAALELLGRDFRWYTNVYASGKLDRGTLDGDLIIRASNDPSITWTRLEDLVKRLRKRGLKSINGSIAVDRSLYAASAEEELSWVAETSNPWNSPPDSLVLNGKVVTLRFTPEPKTRTVTVAVDPPLASVKLRGSVAFVDGPCTGNGAGIVVDPGGDIDHASIRVAGSLASGCSTRSVPVSVLAHKDYFQQAFAQLWRSHGGEWNGSFSEVTEIPRRALLIESTASAPLADVIKEINKNSNNLMTRQLFLELAISADDRPQKVKLPLATRAFDVVRRLLAERRVSVPELVIENGAGLSVIERITPRGFARLLDYALDQPYANDLIASLPIVGFDGTMRDRLKASPAAGTAYMKTGTLPEVRGLAGYVWDAIGKVYLVVVLVNHRNAAAAVGAIDASVDWLHRRPNGSTGPEIFALPSAPPDAKVERRPAVADRKAPTVEPARGRQAITLPPVARRLPPDVGELQGP